MAPRIQTTIEGELVTDYDELKARYYATKFYLDVTCSLPIDTVFEIYAYRFLPQDLSVELYLTILRLPKALLFVRLLESLNHVAVKLSTHINSAYIRIFSQLILIYMVTHWVGCAWVLYSHYYGFGSDEFVMSKEWEGRSQFAQYEYALFWGLRQMTGGDTGTGAPVNRSERIFAVFISLAGLTVYASIISSLAAIVQHVTEEQNNIQDKLENLHNYLRRKQIPNNLRSRITKYMEYKLYHEQDTQEREVFDELPESLKADVILHMNKSLIAKVPFLTGCSEKIMHELILKLKPTVFAPNEYVFRATE